MSFNIEPIGFTTCGGAEYCLTGPDNTSNVNGPPTPGTSIVGLTSFTVTLVSVPEASAWMMMLVGFVGLGLGVLFAAFVRGAWLAGHGT